MAKRDYGFVIIGGGGGGMAAAIKASDAGSTVLLCEADDKLGGSTALSGSVYCAAGTSIQLD